MSLSRPPTVNTVGVWNRSQVRHGDAPASERATQPLTRPRIVAAGPRLLERQGAAGLGMRKLAGEMGKAPAAVYRHVSGKRELMFLLFDEVSRRIVLPDARDDPRTASWRRRRARTAWWKSTGGSPPGCSTGQCSASPRCGSPSSSWRLSSATG
ncbi:TetR/AcrR family transcriptional regulator [Streptomyces sp. NPDC055039]